MLVWEMGGGGGVVVISAGQEYVGGIRSPGIVSSAADVLLMNAVRGMREVGRVCELRGIMWKEG